MNEQPTKLQLLVRRNKGRTEHQYYATELSHRLKVKIGPSDLVDLAETDRVFVAHKAQAARSKEADFAFRTTWAYQAKDSWLEACQRLGEKLRDELAILFVGPYEFCGAVKVNADQVLNAAASLLEFDRDTVGLESVTLESGLFLDLFEEESEWFVELVVWGKWKALAE